MSATGCGTGRASTNCIISRKIYAVGHHPSCVQAAQDVLKGKDVLEPGVEKVVLIKLQKIVSAGGFLVEQARAVILW
jgi:hypothetical protein